MHTRILWKHRITFTYECTSSLCWCPPFEFRRKIWKPDNRRCRPLVLPTASTNLVFLTICWLLMQHCSRGRCRRDESLSHIHYWLKWRWRNNWRNQGEWNDTAAVAIIRRSYFMFRCWCENIMYIKEGRALFLNNLLGFWFFHYKICTKMNWLGLSELLWQWCRKSTIIAIADNVPLSTELICRG